MNFHIIVEAIGYLGSALVLVSFLMTSVFHLRLVNAIGGIIFFAYALIIKSYPTAIMNLCLVLINIHFLWKIKNTKRLYEAISVQYKDSFLQYMLSTYSPDILKCFPGISLDFGKMTKGYVVFCESTPASIFIAEENQGKLKILLDYSTPQYRDFSIGSFLLEKLKQEGITCLEYSKPAKGHKPYLQKLGFIQTGDVWIKQL